MHDRTAEIRKFWDDRAREFGQDWRATLGEEHLRLLEIGTVTKYIRRNRPARVLDVGCGNGYSTKIFAARFPMTQFVGIDYSGPMIDEARRSAAPNVQFEVGDVLHGDSMPEGAFDLVLTQRCLQNIPERDLQWDAIRNLLAKRAPGGALLLTECSKDGVEQLNRMRERFGRQRIPDIEPWHNNFFRDSEIVNEFNAKIVHFASTYMFVSRIIHVGLGGIARRLPAIGRFGYDKIYLIR